MLEKLIQKWLSAQQFEEVKNSGKLDKVGEIIEKVPTIFTTADLRNEDKTVWLHYQISGMHLFVIEGNLGEDYHPTVYGIIVTSDNPLIKLKYIELFQWLDLGATLDLDFEPCKVSELISTKEDSKNTVKS